MTNRQQFLIHPAILVAISNEHVRAYLKHKGVTPINPMLTDREKLVILVEEIGEVANAMTYDEGNEEKLYTELIQVAAMAASWAECKLKQLKADGIDVADQNSV